MRTAYKSIMRLHHQSWYHREQAFLHEGSEKPFQNSNMECQTTTGNTERYQGTCTERVEVIFMAKDWRLKCAILLKDF